ncbi:hypothetical protein FSP39_022393 [Pinctada imbricata]|uniref:Sulfotransferase domain-containing protein n=1 Tax=Pinctada imbricata TaxID=66713 RepID=A0AA89C0U6_PINIB|nr:hypothetical protein FSP39_022393 [Pinctada imbricata]
MRSGSSMTSELLQQSEFTFFMFEPFWGVYGSAHRRPNVVCAQDLSNTCKNPEGFDQSEQGNLMLLEGLFNCPFQAFANRNSAVKFILLMSYMRSGSSMTSELLQQSEYTFFMFEPFWGVYGSAHRRPNVVCAQDLSNSCKNPSGFYQSEQGNLMLLEDLFNCRFKHLPIGVLESFAVFYPNTGYNASRSCFPTGVQKYPGSFYRAILKSKVKPVCFDILEDMCQRAKVRLIKTIRLPMSFARNILERIPNLNLVHLLRDPRGMIHSRAVINYVKLKHGSYPFERLCGWIDDDLEEIKQLIPRFSERIILILYDCLVLNPFQISELLYEYLNLEFNQNVVDWITSHMVSHLIVEEEFVKAGNSLNISRSWRSTIGFDTLRMIDRACETVHKKLGLRRFENVQDLRNITNSNLIDIKRCLIEKKISKRLRPPQAAETLKQVSKYTYYR